MSNRSNRMCVLLPCGDELRWAVPQTCLAEILTLPSTGDVPPESVSWRGLDIAVFDIGAGSGTPWRTSQSGTGLVVIMLGVKDKGREYWGLAIRGDGLSVRNVQESDCRDMPDSMEEYSLAAFELDGATYQVPDLPTLQQRLATNVDKAIPA